METLSEEEEISDDELMQDTIPLGMSLVKSKLEDVQKIPSNRKKRSIDVQPMSDYELNEFLAYILTYLVCKENDQEFTFAIKNPPANLYPESLSMSKRRILASLKVNQTLVDQLDCKQGVNSRGDIVLKFRWGICMVYSAEAPETDPWLSMRC